MPTTGTVLSKSLAIYVDGVKVTCQTDAEVTLSTETFDTTCKDSGAWSEPRPGTKSWGMSGTANLAYDAVLGFKQLFDAWSNQTLVDVAYDTGVLGDFALEGGAYVTELGSASQGNDSAVTFTYTLTGVGDVTYTS